MLDDLLVVAWDLSSDSRVHVSEQTLEHWRRKGYGSDRTLVCMYCLQLGERVALVVKGKVLGARRAHFAHPASSAHVTCSGPETAWHADGKWLIADMARRHAAVDLALIEWPTTDNKRRADVRVLLRDGSKLAFELQAAPLTDRDYLARCEDYERNNITCVWLWRPDSAGRASCCIYVNRSGGLTSRTARSPACSRNHIHAPPTSASTMTSLRTRCTGLHALTTSSAPTCGT